jgi:UDP-N-acetylglucosamine 3-dehydrogenase
VEEEIMDKLKVGVVGLGLGRHFVAACAVSESVDRLVICDPDAKRLEQIQSEFPSLAKGYGNLETMLEAEQLDAVNIVTPDHLHRPHSTACFAAGCHVLQTKPLATNLEDARAIVRAADDADKILMVAHERRFRTSVIAMKEILDAGEVGEIIHLRIDAIQDKRGQFRKSPWYASAEAGRTALVGTGIHEVDLMRCLMGKPITSVSAYSNRLGTMDFPKDKTTAALYQFEGGAIGQVTVTYEAHWPKGGRTDDHFRLIGTKGMIVGNRVGRDGQDGWTTLPQDQSEIVTGIKGCVDSFLKAIVEDVPVPVSGREGFASLAACVAADESAATGQPTVPAPSDFQ